jgi:thiol-disulfide isomerase/thioredoxin
MRLASTVLIATVLLGCRTAEQATLPDDSSRASEPNPAAEQLELRGQVLGNDGRPLAAAHVRLRRNGYRELLLDGVVEGEGRFDVALPGPGAYDLTLAGVDHASKELALLVGETNLEVSARLGTYARTSAGETVGVRLRWITAEAHAGEPIEATATQVRPNTYALSLDPPVDARALQYQLTGLTDDRSYNGPGGTRWQYDGGGDFWAEIDVADAKRLELDLEQLPAAKLPAEVEVHGAFVYPRSRAIDLLWAHMEELSALFRAEQDATKVGPEVRRIALAARQDIEALEDPNLAKAATLEWAWFFGQFGRADWIDVEDMRWVFARVPADDPTWAFVATFVHSIFAPYADDPQLAAFRAELLERQRDPGLRAQLLLLDITEAEQRGDLQTVETLYAQLARDYPGTQAAFVAETRFDPDRPLLVGKRMPDWSYPSLDGQGTIGSEQLRGRPYLLEVWATWCGPCVEEMKHLHEAHAALARAGEDALMTFVALSIDETRESVQEFRRGQWPMPWHNAWVPPAEQDALHEAWRFSSVPLLVLVDADGTIVAASETLRGDALLPTLQAFLARAGKGH